MKYTIFSTVVLACSGCAPILTNPHFNGDKNGVRVKVATVQDTVTPDGTTRAHFFYLNKVGTQEILNALNLTVKGNYGKGLGVRPYAYRRLVPANRPLSIEICAETHNGAPILDLLRKDFKKCESLEFAFKADEVYAITGTIDEKSAIVEINMLEKGR